MNEHNAFRVWDKKEKCYSDKAWAIEGASGNLFSLLTHLHLDPNDFVVERCTGYRYANNNAPIYFGDLVQSASYAPVWAVVWNAWDKKVMLMSLQDTDNTPMSKRLTSGVRYTDFDIPLYVKVGTFFEEKAKKESENI